jgi:Flp pilus assembly protein TadB
MTEKFADTTNAQDFSLQQYRQRWEEQYRQQYRRGSTQNMGSIGSKYMQQRGFSSQHALEQRVKENTPKFSAAGNPLNPAAKSALRWARGWGEEHNKKKESPQEKDRETGAALLTVSFGIALGLFGIAIWLWDALFRMLFLAAASLFTLLSHVLLCCKNEVSSCFKMSMHSAVVLQDEVVLVSKCPCIY